MRTILFTVGIILSLLLITIIVIVGYAFIEGPRLDRESHIWVDTVVPQIIKTWDVQTMLDNGSPEFLQATPRASAQGMFSSFSNGLGKFIKYDGSTGEAGIQIDNGSQTITAKYVATGEYVKGTAEINITAIKRHERWEILGFTVNLRPSSQSLHEDATSSPL
jgi:hypothetical protein